MFTTAHIARIYGVTPRRILAIAKARGIQPLYVVGRGKLWASAEPFKPGQRGRPSGKRTESVAQNVARSATTN